MGLWVVVETLYVLLYFSNVKFIFNLLQKGGFEHLLH